MGKLGKIQECVLQELAKREQMSRVELLCAVYGFRLSAGNVLSWSIAERRLLQTKDFTAATELLKGVLELCESIGFPDEIRLRRERTDPDRRFNLVSPPQEIVVRHARREWRGSPVMLPIAHLSALTEFLKEPYQVEVPEQLGEHPWYQLDQQLEHYIRKWRWKHWQRHSVERQHAEDISIAREKNEANVNIARALQSLEKQGRISISGTRKDMKIALVNAHRSLALKKNSV